jgi:hypothetical protein
LDQSQINKHPKKVDGVVSQLPRPFKLPPPPPTSAAAASPALLQKLKYLYMRR